MNENYIVRVDFYPNGDIIPLGITDKFGETHYVNSIKRITHNNENEYLVECLIEESEFILKLKNNEWICFKK